MTRRFVDYGHARPERVVPAREVHHDEECASRRADERWEDARGDGTVEDGGEWGVRAPLRLLAWKYRKDMAGRPSHWWGQEAP